jgi:hypothetical protein
MAVPANLLIGTPAYGGQVHIDYVSAILGYQNLGIPFGLMTIGNESLITRGRNTILATFYERREFTHLLFLDADVYLPPEGLKRLIAHGKDVVGAPVALKTPASDAARAFNIGAALGEEGPLVMIDRIGSAALLLSRAAGDALVAEARADGRVYQRDARTIGGGDAQLHYDVFQVGVADGLYLSEDFWACRRLRALGFPIYVDPAIVTRHNGVMAV